MGAVFFKAYYTPPFGTEIELKEFFSSQQSRGLEIKQSKAEFVLKNSAYRNKSAGESIFIEDGLIEVYADYSPITRATNQLLLSGQLREIAPSLGSNGAQTKLTFADRTALVLGSLHAKNYESQTVDAVIRAVIADSPISTGVTTNNVVSTTQSGGAFPIVDFALTFKPIYDWISELSQTEKTGEDRTYIFYVDKDNDLHWFYPSQTVSTTIVEGVDEVYSSSFKKNADSVINMIIFNAGQDLNGNGVLWYYYDVQSRSNELRMKYQPMVDLSTGQYGLFTREIAAGNLTASTTGTVPFQGLLYTPVSSGTTSFGVAFSNFSEYNDAVRQFLKDEGQARSSKITKAFGRLRWSGTCTLRGTNSFVAGDLIEYTSKTSGLISQKLRVYDVTHSFTNNGWQTTLELREDEDAIAAE